MMEPQTLCKMQQRMSVEAKDQCNAKKLEEQSKSKSKMTLTLNLIMRNNLIYELCSRTQKRFSLVLVHKFSCSIFLERSENRMV